MPARFSGRILAHLAHDSYRPISPDLIESQMQIPPEDHEYFASSLQSLLDEEQVGLSDDGKVRLAAYGDEMVGVIKMSPRGFGFVRPDVPTREGDLHIPRGDASDAVSGDRVRCRVFRRSSRHARGRGASDHARRNVTGRVVEIIERGRSTFAGRLFQRSRNWLVEPDGRELKEPVLIRDPHVKDAKEGDKVIFELVLYPDEHGMGEGVITEVLGEANRPDVETRAIIETHGLRTEFPEAAIEEARQAASKFEEESRNGAVEREDLTELLTFTIDPPDARDYDDAISVTHDPTNDEWELGIHIADVAHFVELDSALDREARARGNSVYLPRMVIPMLPEILSNGVCSLQEDVPRFTKSVFITINAKGNVVDQRLSRTSIRSRRRLTYLEAQAVIDGDLKTARQHAKSPPVYDEDLVEALRQANRLARVIRERRLRKGMLVLAMPEFELVFDEEGHVIDAQPEDDAFTHTLIEMFMVEANEAVARTFADIAIPLLRRVHPEPAYHDVSELRDYARIIGLGLPEEPDRFDIKNLLDATRDSPAARAVHFAVLRTLTKAEYSPALIGHYALAGRHYAHFTSPIRRYPDLLVLLVLDAYLDHTENGRRIEGGRARRKLQDFLASDSRVHSDDLLVEIGRHCSDTEIAAEQAERELRRFLVLQFIQEEHMGGEFNAVITHVTGGGRVFASLEKLLIEGIAHASESAGRVRYDDRWVVDEQSGRLVARGSGASIGLGDQVRVRVLRVDPAARELELAIIEFMDRAPMMARSRGDGRGRGRLTGPINRTGKGKGKGNRKGKGKGKGRRGRRG